MDYAGLEGEPDAVDQRAQEVEYLRVACLTCGAIWGVHEGLTVSGCPDCGAHLFRAVKGEDDGKHSGSAPGTVEAGS